MSSSLPPRKNPFEGLSGPTAGEPVDERFPGHEKGCDCDEYAAQIEAMVEEGEYLFAQETLESLHEYYEKNGHFTDRQKDAVTNIEEGGNRHGG